MTGAPVLLVEDRLDDVLLTLRAFAKAGFDNELVVLPDGEACMAALLPDDRQAALSPVLVLLDISLPKIDGLEVLRRIRADERTSHLSVVMLTTSVDRTDVVNSYRLGANSFVRKPVSYAEFAYTMRILGAYWLAVNEPCPPGPPSR